MISKYGSNSNVDLSKFQTPIPTLDNQSADEVNEGDYIEIDITNYEEGIEYIANDELITKIKLKSDKTFKIYVGSVDEDTDIDFQIRAFKKGYLRSEWSESTSVTIKDLPEEEDDAIINDAFADNEDSSSDCDVTNDKVVFTEDGGEYKEVITEQGDDEEDWSSYQTIARIELEKMDIIDDDTDKDTLAVKNEKIKDVSKCYIINDDYPDGVEIDIGDVDEDKVDNTDTLDILDDGSCIAAYKLDDDLKDLSGNYDLTAENDYSFEDAYANKGVHFDSDSSRLKNNDIDASTGYTASIWVKLDNKDGDNQYLIDTRDDGDNGSIFLFNLKDGTIKHDDAKNNKNSYCYINNGDKIDLPDGSSVDFTFETNKWYHIVYYIPTLNGWTLGSRFENDGYTIPGTIDQVRIFNKELSEDNVDTLYNKDYKEEYKADISSNDLDNAPTSAYFIEENVTIKTALTKDDDPTEDDFNDEDLDTWTINDDNDYKENSYKKVSDYGGNKFQREVIGDKNANITYLKSNMWKDS